MPRSSRLATIAICLYSISCLDQPDVTAPASGRPAFTISDALHSAGNRHFYFLPPIVSQPTTAGVFDPTLSPSVEVCEWTGSCGPEVAQFTASGGTGGATVRMDPTAQQYLVNWDT